MNPKQLQQVAFQIFNSLLISTSDDDKKTIANNLESQADLVSLSYNLAMSFHVVSDQLEQRYLEQKKESDVNNEQQADSQVAI